MIGSRFWFYSNGVSGDSHSQQTTCLTPPRHGSRCCWSRAWWRGWHRSASIIMLTATIMIATATMMIRAIGQMLVNMRMWVPARLSTPHQSSLASLKLPGTTDSAMTAKSERGWRLSAMGLNRSERQRGATTRGKGGLRWQKWWWYRSRQWWGGQRLKRMMVTMGTRWSGLTQRWQWWWQ
jgi:hypothetical protein